MCLLCSFTGGTGLEALGCKTQGPWSEAALVNWSWFRASRKASLREREGHYCGQEPVMPKAKSKRRAKAAGASSKRPKIEGPKAGHRGDFGQWKDCIHWWSMIIVSILDLQGLQHLLHMPGCPIICIVLATSVSSNSVSQTFSAVMEDPKQPGEKRPARFIPKPSARVQDPVKSKW